jgi:hypothetical protein
MKCNLHANPKPLFLHRKLLITKKADFRYCTLSYTSSPKTQGCRRQLSAAYAPLYLSYSVPMNRGWDWIEQGLLLGFAVIAVFLALQYLRG